MLNQGAITQQIMTRNDGMFPFYREALSKMTSEGACRLNDSGFGAQIRKEYGLWSVFGDHTIAVSSEILLDVWDRLR